MASLFPTAGLNLDIYEPPWLGGAWVSSYTDYVKSYSHDLAAIGGFVKSDIELMVQPIGALEDWVENGLGREVKITSGSGFTVFEGFVNRLEFTIGGFHLVYGPFMDIANNIALLYSLIDWSSGTAVTGLRGVSTYLSDAASIRKYGKQSKLLSTGGIQVEIIPDLLALTLDKLKRPAKSEDLSFGSGSSNFGLRISLLGWVSFLEKYAYNNTTTTQVNISEKIRSIVTAEPNAIFNTSGIGANTLQISQWENDNAIAWGLIKNLLALGDASSNRYIFGVYESRKVKYSLVSDIITYLRPLKEDLESVLDVDSNLVLPWEVRPGNWVQILDLMPSKREPLDDAFTGNDHLFIESVSFSAPNQLTLNGSQSFKLDQRLAQLGISGLGI